MPKDEEQKLQTPSKYHKEANLIWDEYKYRHDLIWKHLIRSTVAVLGAIALLFDTNVNFNKLLGGIPFFVVISGLVIFYVLFTYWVIYKELVLLYYIKSIHRNYQYNGYKIPKKVNEIREIPKELISYRKWKFWKSNFNVRVIVLLTILLIVSIIVFLYLVKGVDCNC